MVKMYTAKICWVFAEILEMAAYVPSKYLSSMKEELFTDDCAFAAQTYSQLNFWITPSHTENGFVKIDFGHVVKFTKFMVKNTFDAGTNMR